MHIVSVCVDWMFHFTLSVSLKVNRTSFTQLEHVKLFVFPAGPLKTVVVCGHGMANNQKDYQRF